MNALTIGAIVGLVLLVTLALGMPVAFALGLTALISIVLFLTVAELAFFADFLFSSLNDFALLAIPLFVLMGAIFGHSKASQDLLEAAHVWVGRLPGGLAMSSVMACSVFAALTGSSPATSAAIGKIAIPEMTKRGYPNGLATGAIVAGGTLGILIPPSVTLILYGIATETSIGRLFLGGVVPGIMVTLLFCLWILAAVFLGRRSASSQQQTSGAGDSDATSQTVAGAESYSWGHRFGVLIKIIPFVVLIASVLGVLYLGIATPSEAAGVGAFLAIILVALLYRSVNVRNLMDIALETTRTSTMILMIVAFSAVLGQILTFLNVPQGLAQLVADLEVNRWVVFVIMNLLFLFLGGVVPGIMVTLLFCLWILVAVFSSRRSGRFQQQTSDTGESGETSQTIGAAESYSWKHRFGVLTKVIPFAVLIACVLGVLYLGIATPSEAAGVGALLALILVALLYRSVNLRNLMGIALETTRTSTMILMIVAFSAVLGQVLSFLNVPQELAQLVADLEVNRWVVFLIMNLLFLGFFIPPVAIILVTMPVLFPIITELGFDPIWFGVVMTLNMEMGLITPPVGLNLYVVQGIAPDIPLRDILVGSPPYVGVLALGIIILALFPGLVTWLPNQALGG